MTTLDELVVRIRADASQLEREMKKAGGVVQQSAGNMGGAFTRLKAEVVSLAPALSAVAFAAFGKQALETAGHIADLSDRIGFAGTTLAALEAPLVAGGSNLDEFSAAVNRMNNLVGEAGKGNEEAVKSFDQLGLSVSKLRQLSPEDQFYAIARAVGQIKDQSTQTEAGMNIFGRGFAALLPLLKQYEGDMRKAVGAQTDLNAGLSQDAIDRIDRFGDALSDAGIKARNAFLEAFAALLKVIEAVPKAEKLADDTAARYQLGGDGGIHTDRKNFKFGQAGGLTSRTDAPHTQFPLEEVDRSATGDNKALLGIKAADEQAKKYAEAKKSLDEYVTSLDRQNVILGQSPREQAALEAMYKQQDLAKKANVHLTADEIEHTKGLARANYDLAESMQEAARFQQVLHDKLSQTLTDIAFNFDSAADSAKNFALAIAEAAFQKRIAGPLSDAIVGKGGGDGLLDGAFGFLGKQFGGFFADGGSPPVGVPSVVGERGPELFVPSTAGTIIPNGRLGGGTNSVTHVWNIQSGVTKQELASIIPVIEGRATAATLHAMRQGGDASRIIGARS